MKTAITELIPTSSRKSFGHKALVLDDGKAKYLRSYDTVVASVGADGRVHRHWTGSTPEGRHCTTDRHIRSFIETFSAEDISTKAFYALPLELPPRIKIEI